MSAAIGAPAAPPAGPVTVRVAVLEPATGDFVVASRLVRRGFELGASHSVGATGRQVNIVVRRQRLSPKFKPARLAAGLKRLGTQVVVLPCAPDLHAKIARAIVARGMSVLAPCESDARAGYRIKNYRAVGMTGNAEAAQLVTFAKLQNGTSGVILTSSRFRYTSTMAQYFRLAAAKQGLKILATTPVAIDGSGLDTVAAGLKASKPRGIFTSIPSPYAERLILGLRSRGIITPIYVSAGMDVPIDLDVYGDAMKDVTFTSYGFPRPDATKALLDPYAQKFREPVYGGYPGLGFEMARLVRVVAQRAGSGSPAKLNAAFKRGMVLPGLAGPDSTYPRGGGRNPVTDVALARIIRGEYVPVRSSVPIGTPPA